VLQSQRQAIDDRLWSWCCRHQGIPVAEVLQKGGEERK
jgi:hypothetical protein